MAYSYKGLLGLPEKDILLKDAAPVKPASASRPPVQSQLDYLSVESARTRKTKKEAKEERSDFSTNNSNQASELDTDSESSSRMIMSADK